MLVMTDATVPDAAAFETEIRRQWVKAEDAGADFVDIEAGEVHRQVGGYPAPNHRMPECCHVMRRMMVAGDEVVGGPPSGTGATLVIRYRLPRLVDYSVERA